MLNIVVPMAGRGSRFAEAGYEQPKPLIPVHEKPMIKCVVENIMPSCPHRFIFLCLEEHLRQFDLENLLRSLSPDCHIIRINEVTQGAACTVLLARKHIDNDDALMIANSDQLVDIDINDYLSQLDRYDGLIMTMKSNHPKWSYIGLDDENLVTVVKEKEVISDEATVGIYNYRCGSDFVMFAEQMISKNIRVNGEFYVAPVYNEMIASGKRVTYCNVGAEGDGMYGLGIPKDLEAFRKLPQSEGC